MDQNCKKLFLSYSNILQDSYAILSLFVHKMYPPYCTMYIIKYCNLLHICNSSHLQYSFFLKLYLCRLLYRNLILIWMGFFLFHNSFIVLLRKTCIKYLHVGGEGRSRDSGELRVCLWWGPTMVSTHCSMYTVVGMATICE